jgi:hypothetical protein
LLLKIKLVPPEASKVCGGREFWRKIPLTPTPNSPLAFELEEANARVWVVGTLGKGIELTPSAMTRTSAAVRLPNGALWRSSAVFTGWSCVLKLPKALSSTLDTSAGAGAGVSTATSSKTVDEILLFMVLPLNTT